MSDPVTRLNAALEGRYRIERELGEGGMATVYLADDLKHERKVALKVLKPELAAVVGADRFLAEIKTTANLQHPHILPLFDSGEADSFLFYVMPFVEGETLRDRLEREKQLPVDEAVRIATDVAEALHAAHKQGVIHRDIKPANILMSEGRPLVADFGIALAVSAAGGGRLTETGLSMGTPYYMSPEQASADREPSAASDVYSLGCVLYEMLVGEPPYVGSSAQAVLAKILMGDAPAPTATRPSIPANVDAAIRKALEKLPADRFASAAELARALGDGGFRHGPGLAATSRVAQGPWKALSMAAFGLAAITTLVAAWALTEADEPLPLEVFELSFREGQRMLPNDERSLSEDGTTLVYVVRREGADGQLWVRRWDDLAGVARPIPGTERAFDPAISPEGTRVAFVQGGIIKVLPLDGGAPVELTGGLKPVWGPDGFIYATLGGYAGTLRVPAGGGQVDTLSHRAEGEIWHVITDFLPDGSPLLTVLGSIGEIRVRDVESPDEIRIIDLEDGEIRPLIQGSFPKYAATDHLVYTDGSTLTAIVWDPRARSVVGPPVPIIEDVRGQVELSATGKLLYTIDPLVDRALPDELVWVDRQGQVSPFGVDFHHGGIFGFGWSLSPDGSRVALRHQVDGNADIWTARLPDGPLERLTVSEADDNAPSWNPDGETVTYGAPVDGFFGLWSGRLDAGENPNVVFAQEGMDFRGIGTWSPDGAWLVTTALSAGGVDVVGLRPGIDSVAVPLIATEFRERSPALSPDGRWLAYDSNRTGRSEVYVRPFPEVGAGRVLVSNEGGRAPVWAKSGQELFFLAENRALVAARVETVPEFRVSSRETLFVLPARVHFRSGSTRFFDVSLDDQRFLMGRAREEVDADRIERTYLVNNFLEELKRRAPN